jgi:hypothetical protein
MYLRLDDAKRYNGPEACQKIIRVFHTGICGYHPSVPEHYGLIGDNGRGDDHYKAAFEPYQARRRGCWNTGPTIRKTTWDKISDRCGFRTNAGFQTPLTLGRRQDIELIYKNWDSALLAVTSNVFPLPKRKLSMEYFKGLMRWSCLLRRALSQCQSFLILGSRRQVGLTRWWEAKWWTIYGIHFGWGSLVTDVLPYPLATLKGLRLYLLFQQGKGSAVRSEGRFAQPLRRATMRCDELKYLTKRLCQKNRKPFGCKYSCGRKENYERKYQTRWSLCNLEDIMSFRKGGKYMRGLILNGFAGYPRNFFSILIILIVYSFSAYCQLDYDNDPIGSELCVVMLSTHFLRQPCELGRLLSDSPWPEGRLWRSKYLLVVLLTARSRRLPDIFFFGCSRLKWTGETGKAQFFKLWGAMAGSFL